MVPMVRDLSAYPFQKTGNKCVGYDIIIIIISPASAIFLAGETKYYGTFDAVAKYARVYENDAPRAFHRHVKPRKRGIIITIRASVIPGHGIFAYPRFVEIFAILRRNANTRAGRARRFVVLA